MAEETRIKLFEKSQTESLDEKMVESGRARNKWEPKKQGSK